MGVRQLDEGSATSQNSVRDFEIPDFSIGFQISNKISNFWNFVVNIIIML